MGSSETRLTFHGAAQTVTGSAHLLEHNGRRVLLDCGLTQGRRKEAFEANRHPFVDPASLDAIILSHAHIDHSGNLPTYRRLGFKGPVYATPATRDLCDVMLRDSANVQVRQVELVNRLRGEQRKNPFEPLYTEEDVARTLERFRPVPYGRTQEVLPGLRLTFHDAGHILGSALCVLDLGRNGSSARLLFTGDLGRKNCVILRDPALTPPPDWVISESTYGDRTHAPCAVIKDQLAELIDTVRRRKSRLLIPAFTVGRLQTLIYYMHQLYEEGRIGNVPILVDSPLGRKATEVFRDHSECYDAEANAFILRGGEPFSFERLRFAESVEDSKKINNEKGPLVIISSSGMCEGGRILHHLTHAVEEPNNIILLSGFQAANTLGRRLQEGVSPVNILGRPYPLRARVVMIEAFSAHADSDEIVEYFRECKATPSRAFLVHGEPPQPQALARRLQEGLGWSHIDIPAPGDSFTLA
jgi:metallo-beta-lactamase family protein